MKKYRSFAVVVVLLVLLASACSSASKDSSENNNTVNPDPAAESVSEQAPTASPDPRNFSGTLNADWQPVVQAFDGVEMVLVPAGCFTLGVPAGVSREMPARRVCFEEPFWIDRIEVTNARFTQFSGKLPHELFAGDNRPRVFVSWDDAAAYCASRGGRLPTEAEWEYAARGVEGWSHPWGNDWDQTRVIGYREDDQGTADVGSAPGDVSWVGALDMSGNASEWVADWYAENAYSLLTDGIVNPTGPTSGTERVVRGGAWNWIIPGPFSATFRNFVHPALMDPGIGFRCVRAY